MWRESKVANPYENYEAIRTRQSEELRREAARYRRNIQLAVLIMCQQAARNYFLRVGGADGAKSKEIQDGQ